MPPDGPGARNAPFEDLGPNSGLVEDLYRRFVENPASVPERWRDFFADRERGAPAGAPVTAGRARPAVPAAATIATTTAAPAAPVQAPTGPVPAAGGPAPATTPAPRPAPGGAPAEALRGAAARVVENMEASLGVPTATSVRTVPAKLLEINRQILNNHLGRTGAGKVSFTHLIAWAVVRALHDLPDLNASYTEVDGTPAVVRHEHVNLGLAVDVTRRDGTRTLLVPNVKRADTLDFAAFWRAYEDVIRRVRSGSVTPDDFAGTTGTITNPGMIGTVHSVPRLMPGQGFIIGVGAIGYPAEYEGADPHTIAQLGVSKVTTLTSTYDHRIIGGAQSGELLRRVHDLLLGDDAFYDDVFRHLGVPYEPARWRPDEHPLSDPATQNEKAVHVHQLVNLYRVRGHLVANLDPLAIREPHTPPELDMSHHGLSIWDLDREFPVGSLGAGRFGRDTLTLREILGVLRDAYARTVGVEYMHIQEPDQKVWIQEHLEGRTVATPPETKRRILERLNAAEAFERFLHTKYLGQKRFSLEGAETLIPMLDALCSRAADEEVHELVIGMAHRGRLNVLANVVGKSYGQIFREFEGELDPSSTQGSGDVKYHLGATGTHRSPAGGEVRLCLAGNPSHLEAVDPVVEGMTRAKQDGRGDRQGRDVIPVLIHGDAAFAGQGVVAETLNLSAVDGYDVGGTVHVVVNNQVGFTTAPEAARSSVYATDVAKMVQAPIFHVNCDDPEAAVRVIELAFAFRQAFRKDVVVDLVCYRRYGHNEGDEPAYTQPRMYAQIAEHKGVRELYTDRLVQRGDITGDEATAALADFRARLDRAFAETRQPLEAGDEELSVLAGAEARPAEPHVDTTVPRATLERIVAGVTTWPAGFGVHPKLERILRASRAAFERGDVDWSLAESLAFGSLLLDGTTVRLAGQDTRRGTFSQRHGTLVDFETGEEYTPLANLSATQAPYRLYDSVLSEYAALGFEYGYTVGDPDALVLWEAQFGDFANGAQIVIDQFVVAAEDKWGQRSSLTLLLPHGFEGQGPEHSSARIERFLALCAGGNLRVAYPTTAAQQFHLLRRQAASPRTVPLVCFTPKRFLRVAETRSPVRALTDGRFEVVLDDAGELDRREVRRVLLATGKVAHELVAARDHQGAPVAVVRVEQLYPWPEAEIRAVLGRYPEAGEVWWVQEEPANMGAWGFVQGRLHRLLSGWGELRFVARKASPSPATGSPTVHEREQQELLRAALADVR